MARGAKVFLGVNDTWDGGVWMLFLDIAKVLKLSPKTTAERIALVQSSAAISKADVAAELSADGQGIDIWLSRHAAALVSSIDIIEAGQSKDCTLLLEQHGETASLLFGLFDALGAHHSAVVYARQAAEFNDEVNTLSRLSVETTPHGIESRRATIRATARSRANISSETEDGHWLGTKHQSVMGFLQRYQWAVQEEIKEESARPSAKPKAARTAPKRTRANKLQRRSLR